MAGHPRALPILLKTWSAPGSHRFRYINTSLPSLLDSDLPAGVRLIIVDDVSTDPRLQRLLERLAADARVDVWRNPTRMGPNLGQEYNFPRVVERFPDADVFLLCDDDLVYHPQWLVRLLQVYDEAKAIGLSGIFSAFNVPFRRAFDERVLPTGTVLLKERQAASNWLLPRAVYDIVGPFKDAGIAYDTEYCDRLSQHRLPVVCLKPSYVQNIGFVGAYQTGDEYTAKDYVGQLPPWVRARNALFAARRVIRSLLGR